MRMRYILTVLIFIPTLCVGQLIDELPRDDNGNLYYSETEKVDGINSKELFIRAKQFYVNNFKSAKDVIQMDDKEAGIIIGKGLSQYYIKIVGVDNGPHQLWYTIKIQVKDGRYKYEIYDFFLSGLESAQKERVESQFNKTSYFKKNGQPKDIYEKMKNGMTGEIAELIRSIKDAMNKKKGTDKKDDW